jgi:hypothetical protein
MPEARLQRTRDAYDRAPTAQEILDALPGLPPRPYRVVTDPTTGLSERVYEALRFDPGGHWNVIEGDPHP